MDRLEKDPRKNKLAIYGTRFSTGPRPKGLTLIELVVVLVVLAAIAGLLVPLFGTSVARRGSTSTSITNVSEIEKIMALFANRHPLGHYPNDYDALCQSNGRVFVKMPSEGDGLYSRELLDEEVDALRAAGITTVHFLSDTFDHPTFHPTFNPYEDPDLDSPITIEGGRSLMILTPSASEAIGLSAAGRYVVLGLGRYCTLFSRHTESEATGPPVRFTGEPDINPATTYQRFGVVFQIADAAGPLARARFVRAVGFGETGPVSTEQLVRQWYD